MTEYSNELTGVDFRRCDPRTCENEHWFAVMLDMETGLTLIKAFVGFHKLTHEQQKKIVDGFTELRKIILEVQGKETVYSSVTPPEPLS